jgi:hypothetical protein
MQFTNAKDSHAGILEGLAAAGDAQAPAPTPPEQDPAQAFAAWFREQLDRKGNRFEIGTEEAAEEDSAEVTPAASKATTSVEDLAAGIAQHRDAVAAAVEKHGIRAADADLLNGVPLDKLDAAAARLAEITDVANGPRKPRPDAAQGSINTPTPKPDGATALREVINDAYRRASGGHPDNPNNWRTL